MFIATASDQYYGDGVFPWNDLIEPKLYQRTQWLFPVSIKSQKPVTVPTLRMRPNQNVRVSGQEEDIPVTTLTSNISVSPGMCVNVGVGSPSVPVMVEPK